MEHDVEFVDRVVERLAVSDQELAEEAVNVLGVNVPHEIGHPFGVRPQQWRADDPAHCGPADFARIAADQATDVGIDERESLPRVLRRHRLVKHVGLAIT